jgi:hypothetical protein
MGFGLMRSNIIPISAASRPHTKLFDSKSFKQFFKDPKNRFYCAHKKQKGKGRAPKERRIISFVKAHAVQVELKASKVVPGKEAKQEPSKPSEVIPITAKKAA